MSETTPSPAGVSATFEWEVPPYDMPQPVNEAALATAIEGFGDSDTNLILRLGYAAPPMSVESNDGEPVTIPINLQGTFVLTVDTAAGIRDALNDVLEAMEKRRGE